MREKIIAVSFAKRSDAAKCSCVMRDAVAMLAENGVTFDCVLYPYADSLLLRKEGSFGTHSLFYRVDVHLLEKCVSQSLDRHGEKRLRYNISEIECTASQILKFLSCAPAKKKRGAVCFGGIAQSIGGIVYPWSVRECSKLLCAFAEQTAAIKGVKLIGYMGNGPLFECPKSAREQASELFEKKTGARAVLSGN